MAMGHLAKDHRFYQQASAQYSCALNPLRKEIRNPVHLTQDYTPVGIWLLGLSGALCDDNDRPWAPHAQALARLLKIRGRQQLTTMQGRAIFRMIFGHLVLMNLNSGTRPIMDPTQWISELEDFLPNQPLDRGCEAVLRISQFCASIRDIPLVPGTQDEDLLNLILQIRI
ncbi:uncharacterized protein Z518_11394 [Rhinocladiella mackenziei CBS 650.93]|uniref:Transcription factor domain-containing protein n=1 Tax=Rhinocladiella mackenziei CBS 650.93 TaxID=1442369 RepID=A0A0D2FBD0_9EURO|nr:uncharacterized protein Z518_11394 [Rhinocladiella mackenziei CBS 650.93]KIW99406.1 hypothetical protein Z518_11394 [Rhinocladiella mackenziei CBS 650.93]